MQIDWLTVIAQIVNFLILIWLLKHFLYRPVIDAMDRREQRIAQRLEEAAAREQAAAELQQGYQHRIEVLDGERAQLLEHAREAAESERHTLLDEARADVAEKRSHWQRQVAEEKEGFLRSLRQHAAESIQSIARRALADLADVELEERIVHSFIGRLAALDKPTRRAMADSTKPLRIATAFALTATLRGRLTRAVHEHIGEGIEVDYSEDSDLLCGIEMTAAGRRLSWTLAEYFEELEKRLQAQLETTGGDDE